jgi:hypothetical protein
MMVIISYHDDQKTNGPSSQDLWAIITRLVGPSSQDLLAIIRRLVGSQDLLAFWSGLGLG